MPLNHNLHILWRAGFGPNLSDIQAIDRQTPLKIWEELKDAAKEQPVMLRLSNNYVRDNYRRMIDPTMSKADKEAFNRTIRKQTNQDLKELNDQWLSQMIHSKNQLHEKMSFFWHGHFAIRQLNSYLQLDAINRIRTHALGNFGTMLREVSRSGAMILSLNNQQNRKSAPNENFAREILELFSMGMGHYTETDIKEAARAFTGWSIGPDGMFIFRPAIHDKNNKTIFGQTGKFNGDDVIDLILQQPQTAIFITKKIYQFLVNETPDPKRIEALAASFRKNYEILPLLENIFTSSWFYQEKHIGNKIKSPIELIVGIQRFSPFDHISKNIQMPVQKLLGQILFLPPSIAGWPMGKAWIDSSTIMVRLQLPKLINGEMGIRIKTKADDDANMGRDDDDVSIDAGNSIKQNLTWNQWATKASQANILSTMIINPIPKNKWALINGSEKKEWAIGLMSLPEYQLC